MGATAPAQAKPVSVSERVLAGARARVAEIDLTDPATILTLQLAGTHRYAPFSALAAGAVAINGTFFSLTAPPRTMGTIVTGGTLRHHVSWRPHGTTFGLGPHNVPVMRSAQSAWFRERWLAITAGPRLLTDGAVRLHPAEEGFLDPHVTGIATRSALGYDRAGHRLWLASFHTPLSLTQTAQAMRALGAWQAMNLDGGTSRALAERGHVTIPPGRSLTNALIAYDALTPAPAALARDFQAFRRVTALPPPMNGTDPGPFACGAGMPARALGGRVFNFEDWRFVAAAGHPVVGNTDGWITVTHGDVAARWPVHPGHRFTVTGLARALGSTLALDLGDLRLTHYAGEAALRRGSTLLGRVRTGTGNAGRHLVRLDAGSHDARVFLDGRLVGRTDAFQAAAGVRLRSGTSVKWLLTSRRP